MMRDLLNLAREWWRRDQIRVRPSEGRLFRLRPKAVLCFVIGPNSPHIRCEVVARRVTTSPAEPSVHYTCRTRDGTAELVVTRHQGDRISIRWLTDQGESELSEDEIEVFQATQNR